MVVHASDLRSLSVRGRYAYGLACVERLCGAWGIDDPFVRGEIDAHWGVLDIRLGCHWFDAHPFPQDESEMRAAMRAPGLSSDQLESLHHAFEEARQVFSSSCYAAASDGGSMRAALNVVGILARWGVVPPPVGRFAHATWSGDFGTHGWGDRLGRASFPG